MTRNRLALPARIVKRYTLDVIRGKLPPTQLATPFPKAPSRWKSRYEYRHRSLSRFPDGHLRGGRVRLIAILFDFTFVRSIFAAVYSSQGGHCYDPASLFVLLVFAFVDGYEYLSDFVRDLHHPDKGRQYRELAGIQDDCIPQEADFTNFQQRCGSLLGAVFHVVVEIIAQLGFARGHVLTTDGKLVPTYSRYLGCNYFDEDRCLGLAAPDDLQSLVQRRVDELVAALSPKAPVKGGLVQIRCPFWDELLADHPHLRKREHPKSVPLLHLRLHRLLPGWPVPDGPDGREVLDELGLTIQLEEGIYLEIVQCRLFSQGDRLHWDCPRLPSDRGARLGCRINPRTNQKEWIFGRDVIITSNIEVPLGNLTLPVGVSVHPGNICEGNEFIDHHRQMDEHAFPEKLHVLDGAYDQEDNYTHLRKRGCWPVIDYNPRREDLSPCALARRGYDEKGWPLAHCGRVMPPLEYDHQNGCAVHACHRACQVDEPETDCPYWDQELGEIKRMYTADYLRLVTEIIRGTPQWEKAKGLRSPSESINSYAETCTGLDRPPIQGDAAFEARAHLSILATLLRKVIDFILDMTGLRPKLKHDNDRLQLPPERSEREQRLDQWLWEMLYDP